MAQTIDTLCVCLTPLHVLIAARIYALNGVIFTKGIYITYTDNDKNKFYAKELEKFCGSMDYILLPSEASYPSPKHWHIFLRRLRYRLKFNAYKSAKTVFTGTSINSYLHALLSAVNFEKLVTFDDGILNIKDNSELKNKVKYPAKFFALLSGITYSSKKMISNSTLHYSIYDLKNVFSNVKKIDLLGTVSGEKQKSGSEQVVKIFLGSPPEESTEVWSSINKSIKEIKPDGYIPHPREVEKRISEVEYIDTALVAEHYILSLMADNKNTVCEVYGYEGSALINLSAIDGIKVLSVIPATQQNSAVRDLMKSSGVDFLYH